MNIRTILLILSALTLLFLLNACGDLSSQQSVANDALKSLRKLDASLQVGGSYGQYQSLVIEAQAQVNEALAILPQGELKQEITKAMLMRMR